MDLSTREIVCLAVSFLTLLVAAILQTRKGPSPQTVRILTSFRNAQGSWNNASVHERKNLLFLVNIGPNQYPSDLCSLEWSALPSIVQDSLTESSLRMTPP